MGKLVVLTCDLCGVITSKENLVATVVVAGPKLQLCVEDRVNLLRSVNFTEDDARAYLAVFDERIGQQGGNPTMARVRKHREAQALVVAELVEPAPEAAEEPLVSEPDQEETREVAPARKRK